MQASDRWAIFWQRLGAGGDSATRFKELETLYAEPHRAYHNLAHVMDCLEKLDSAAHLTANSAAVEMALWYHDVVYDPRAKNNEEQSAVLAGQVAEAIGLPGTMKTHVNQLILATKKHETSGNPDVSLMVDIDLSILGAVPSRFDEYECQIRREYDWVTPEAFAAGRIAVLQSFLSRPFIFTTDLFHSRFEQNARENLVRSIARLTSLPSKSEA